MLELKPDFTKCQGLLPAIIQNVEDGEVLMLGYMNAEAFEETRRSGRVVFYSRSKKRLWMKGESSDHFLTVSLIRLDCDADTILILAKPNGETCHLERKSCFEGGFSSKFSFLNNLVNVIKERIAADEEGSYVANLVRSGLSKVAQKVGEEATETVIEAVRQDRKRLISESSDLLFHLLILLEASGLSIEHVIEELEVRAK